MRIELAEQVREFVRACPPEPRRWLRAGLRKLADEKGEIKALRDELEGYYRLRIRSYRVIFRYNLRRNERITSCDFVESRDVLYETFLNFLH
jgi:mRNA-degrading endonuclease RelE of RelBE toxin-antitoxin system